MSATADGAGAVSPAIQAFRDACVYGRVRLSSDRAVKISEKQLPSIAQQPFGGTTRPEFATFIKFLEPSNTYIVIGQFNHTQPSTYSTRCIMFSSHMTITDGADELSRDNPDIEVKQTYRPIFYFPEWTSDAKKYGYLKRMKKLSSGWMRIELARYVDKR